jgi:hypothetical protein
MQFRSGGDEGHRQAGAHRERALPAGRRRRDGARAEDAPRGQDHGPFAHVTALRADVLAGRGAFGKTDAACDAGHVFLHDDGIGPGGQGGTGEHPERVACGQGAGRIARRQIPGKRQGPRAGPGKRRRIHRIAIHRAGIKGRAIGGGGHRGGQHHAARGK